MTPDEASAAAAIAAASRASRRARRMPRCRSLTVALLHCGHRFTRLSHARTQVEWYEWVHGSVRFVSPYSTVSVGCGGTKQGARTNRGGGWGKGSEGKKEKSHTASAQKKKKKKQIT